MSLDARVQVQLGALDLAAELTVADGEVLALLGPNGAGKTTVLRTLSGLQPADAGSVTIDGTVVDDPGTGTWVPPEQRSIGVVFQDHLLFPHLSARDNVAFGLRARGVPRARAREVADTWLERVGVAGHADARPREVSGGQAQRVALARALAVDPALLLLDEPLAALDVTTRAEVRRDLRRHLADYPGSTVLVTHDPLDALALADRVTVLEAGTVTQSGAIAEVTARPRTPYVADLVGVNLLSGRGQGTTVDLDGGGTLTVADPVEGPVLVLVHPHAVSLHRHEPDTSARNRWRCRVSGFDLLGNHVRVRLAGPPDVVAEVTPAAVTELGLVEGGEVWASVKATEVTVDQA